VWVRERAHSPTLMTTSRTPVFVRCSVLAGGLRERPGILARTRALGALRRHACLGQGYSGRVS
jgi:hypothetical protein